MQANPDAIPVPGPRQRPYRGRFAPSPSGPLHFGSIVAALGSWLDARAAGGVWLVRIEDLDPPRVVPGASDTILRQLEGFGLQWDETVIHQSRRLPAYRDALETLKAQGCLYRCDCSRKQILESSPPGLEGPVYGGRCRERGVEAAYAAWRMRTPSEPVLCRDRRLGEVAFRLDDTLGDFVVQRADGVFAYQLAVVVDDHFQGVTDVVRGVDLWLSTPRQIWLQRRLNLPTPVYLHLPLVKNAAGEKLSKQTLAPAVDPREAAAVLSRALRFLGQTPPPELADAGVDAVLAWAVRHWTVDALPPALDAPATAAGTALG